MADRPSTPTRVPTAPASEQTPTSTFASQTSPSTTPNRTSFFASTASSNTGLAYSRAPLQQLSVRADPALLTCFDPADKELYDLWAPKR